MDPFYISPELLRIAEAAVFASREPLTWQGLAPLLPRDLDPGVVFTALEKHCAGRGVILVKAGEGWTFRTAPDLGAKLRQMMTETRRLPRAVMETLVLIALHQPVTRAEIEDIRGVSLNTVHLGSWTVYITSQVLWDERRWRVFPPALRLAFGSATTSALA